jgi:hypothetical protein
MQTTGALTGIWTAVLSIFTSNTVESNPEHPTERTPLLRPTRSPDDRNTSDSMETKESVKRRPSLDGSERDDSSTC